ELLGRLLSWSTAVAKKEIELSADSAAWLPDLMDVSKDVGLGRKDFPTLSGLCGVLLSLDKGATIATEFIFKLVDEASETLTSILERYIFLHERQDELAEWERQLMQEVYGAWQRNGEWPAIRERGFKVLRDPEAVFRSFPDRYVLRNYESRFVLSLLGVKEC